MCISRPYFLALIAATFFLSSGHLNAASVEAEGVAAIGSAGIERARQAAIWDAIDRVSTQDGVDVRAVSRVASQGVPLQSSRVRSSARLWNVNVVREWRDKENCHVRITADLEQPNKTAAAYRNYRKKITATPFAIRKLSQTDDIDDASTGVPNELLRRLESTGVFLIKTNSSHVFSTAATGLSHDTKAVMQIAKLYDSQFVVSGDILDAGISGESGVFGSYKSKQRRFEIEIFVYDGLTGTLISRHKVDDFVEGDVGVGRDKVFGSKSFLSTSFGQAISKTIDVAAEHVLQDLENLPFTARITRVVKEQVYINVGGTSLIVPGDKLVVYRKNRDLSMSGFGTDVDFGLAETPVATLSVVQVQPLFSIGALTPSAKDVEVEAGDLVRFDFDGMSRN